MMFSIRLENRTECGCYARPTLHRFCGTQLVLIRFLNMTETAFANFDLERAIGLRWALRDILAKRTKLTPLKDDDVQALLELGFIEMQDGSPVVTPAGLAALD
ncbi:MAG TPA: hypothetical protein VGP39_18540 [Bradyrhizobium sp.]|jgi:hypothetical protein|nr:hypothetical protein [Bradyrhizobium sp.]